MNGDFLCDTAADPELSDLVHTVGNDPCVYNSANGVTDNWGEIWTPNTSNIMSYSLLKCYSYFSPLQVGKMNYYFTQIGISYPFYSLSGAKYICSGQTSYYSVSSLPGVSSYLWETSSNLPIISGQGSNTITIQATDNYGGYVKVSPGCGYNSRTKTIPIFYDLEIDGYDTACAQNGFSYTYTIPPLSGASYFWGITDGTINYGQGTTSVNISLSPNSSNQTWLALDINGVCSSTVYKYKVITHGDPHPPPPAAQCFAHEDRPNMKDSNNSIAGDDIILFPNPANSHVTIIWPSEAFHDLNLTDVRGREIYSKNNIDERQYVLNLENYQSGIYFIQLTRGTSTVVKRLILNKE